MPLSPQKFREIVFQLLYSQDVAHPDEMLMTELMMGELAVSKKNVRLAQERVSSIRDQLPAIDEKISSVTVSYDFDRIQTVTKNILRLAVFELFFDPSIPPKVAIAEAIRLSRKFSTPESAAWPQKSAKIAKGFNHKIIKIKKGIFNFYSQRTKGDVKSEKREEV